MPVRSLPAYFPLHQLAVRSWCGSSDPAGELKDHAPGTPILLQVLSLRCLCRKRLGPLAPPAAPIHVQSTPSSAPQQQGPFHSSFRAVVAAPIHLDVVGPSEGEAKQRGTQEGGAVSKDPNVVGFVPAFILGNIYVCNLPERQVPFTACSFVQQEPHVHQRLTSCRFPSLFAHCPTLCLHLCHQFNTLKTLLIHAMQVYSLTAQAACSGGKTRPVHRDTADAEATAPGRGRSKRPAPARLALVMAMGSLGPAAGMSNHAQGES